jgi:DNA-binding protein YbaB
MSFMDQAKDMYKLQKKAKQVKKELKNIHVEAEADGVTVVVDGEQNFVEVTIAETISGDVKRIGKGVTVAANKAIKKSQSIAAEKMKAVMGGLKGMFGGQ